MELQVNEIKALEPVKFNYDELKISLTEKVNTYKNMVYTEENIKIAKADRALLNKVSTAINDEKKRIKNLLLEPYVDFENKCKELMAIVEEGTINIDTQVKAFEQKAKDEKLKEIMSYWIENVGEFNDLIDFDLVFNQSWLNSSYSIKKVQTDINHIFEKTKMDMSTLNTTITDPIINKQVKDFYFQNMNNPSILSLAIQESKRIEESNQKLEDLEEKQQIEQTGQVEIQVPPSENTELQQLDFRVWVTQSQKLALREFLKSNNIKFGRVE